MPCNYTGTDHGSVVGINGQWVCVSTTVRPTARPVPARAAPEKITLLPDGSDSPGAGHFLRAERWPAESRNSAAPRALPVACKPPTVPAPTRAKTTIGEEHPYITQDGPDGDIFAQQYVANLRDGCRRGLPQLFAASRYQSYQLPIAALAMVRWKSPQRKVVPRPLYSR